MATVFGGDDYTSPSSAASRSASASPLPESPSLSASASSNGTTPITSYQFCEGFSGKIQKYPGIAGIRRAVDALAKKLNAGETTDQYLVYRPVTVEQHDKIDELERGIRLTHCVDIGTLIIKVPSVGHEKVACRFTEEMRDRFREMGVPKLECDPMGTTTYRGTSSSKQADAAFKSGILRPYDMDWPTIVLEAGVSESVRRLRMDTRWWFSNSEGLVKIVLILHLNRTTHTIKIEKWELMPVTGGGIATRTRSRSNRPAQIPTQVQGIAIRPDRITGAPLTLDFDKIFLRQPNPPEQDLVMTEEDLRGWSNLVWATLRVRP